MGGPAAHVADAVKDDGNGGSTKNWFNLDGTPVPSEDKIWGNTNNNSGLQAYAIFVSDSDNEKTGGKLTDVEDSKDPAGQKFNKAVMKCCGDIPKTFCPAEGDK